MSYEQDKTNSMLYNDPEDMTDHELGLALYHIGAHTILSREFTRDFMDKVVLRASQLLYKEIEWPKVPSFTYSFDVSQKSFEEQIVGDWSVPADVDLRDIRVSGDPISSRYPSTGVDDIPHDDDPKNSAYGYCTCDRCIHDSKL